MMDRMKAGQFHGNVGPVGPVGPLKPNQRKPATQPLPANQASFQTLLQKEMLRFSHHAEVRMQQRGIELKPEQVEQLQSAIDQAASKGAKESLIVLQDLAFIVNVKNRTVVTAVDGDSMKGNVFTQIDSAVIVS